MSREEEKGQDMQDRERQDMHDDKGSFIYSSLTQDILKCCFEVMNTLGIGFAESVYHNALIIAMTNLGLKIASEQCFEVKFKNRTIGQFKPDLLVEDSVIVEIKCCEHLLPEHQAQLINYLAVTGKEVGLLVNFGKRRVEYKRLHHPAYHAAYDHAHPVPF